MMPKKEVFAVLFQNILFKNSNLLGKEKP